MKQFRQHCTQLMLRLLLSEILCLILAFSFALLGSALPLRIAGILCGITAHVLLTGSAAQKAAADDLKLYRQTGFRQPVGKPVLLAIISVIPAYLLYLLLWLLQNSIPFQNAFLLLNAPFIGIDRLLFSDCEPFAAVPRLRQILTGIPPLLTAAAVLAGYLPKYSREIAAHNARTSRA